MSDRKDSAQNTEEKLQMTRYQEKNGEMGQLCRRVIDETGEANVFVLYQLPGDMTNSHWAR